MNNLTCCTESDVFYATCHGQNKGMPLLGRKLAHITLKVLPKSDYAV